MNAHYSRKHRRNVRALGILGLLIGFALASYAQNARPCPEIEINTPNGVLTTRENFDFAVKAKDGTSLDGFDVQWSVSAGALIKNADPSRVTFASSKELGGQNVTITANIKGISNQCAVIVSDTFGIVPRAPIELWDEWGKQSPNQIQERIGSLFGALRNNFPNNEGVLIMYFDKNATRSYKIAQINKIIRAIRSNGYDPTRISFYFDNEYFGENTKVFTFPPNFDYSETEIDPTKLIKGEEINTRLKTLFK